MCTQCVSVSDEQPTRQFLLKANSCNVRNENGRENWNNELIIPLFENITRLAQLHHSTRPEGTTEETSHNSIGQGAQVPPEIRTTANSSVMNTCRFTRTDPHRDVSCMAEITD